MTVLAIGRPLAVVRFREPGDLDGTLDVLAERGVRLVEVTMDTPGRSRPFPGPPVQDVPWEWERSSPRNRFEPARTWAPGSP